MNMVFACCVAVLAGLAGALHLKQDVGDFPITTAAPAAATEQAAGSGWCRNGRLVGNMYCMNTQCQDVGSQNACGSGPNSDGVCCVMNIKDTVCRSAHHVSCALPDRAFPALLEADPTPDFCKDYTWIKVNTQLGSDALGQAGALVAHFKSVTNVNGTNVDLVITGNHATYTPPKGGQAGGRFQDIGFINMESDTSSFNFQFHDSETGRLVKVERFWFSFYGIDKAPNGHAEYLVVDRQNFPYLASFFYPQTDLTVQKNEATGKMRVIGGNTAALPRDPFSLSADQMKSAVSFFVQKPTTGFSFRYGVDGSSPSNRNLEFGFLPSVACPRPQQ